jgi:hypothetical protein
VRLVLARCLPSTTSASHCTSSSPASVPQKHLSTLSALTKQSNSLTESHYYAPAPQLTGFVTPSTSQAWIQKAPPIQLSEEFTIALPLIGTRTLETLNQDYIVLRTLPSTALSSSSTSIDDAASTQRLLSYKFIHPR